MITLETFLLGLLITSTLTGLVTEAVKKILVENNAKVQANTIAGIAAVILSTAISVGYVLISGNEFTSSIIICLIAQVFMSWLCAMIGYDKVIQAISQFKVNKCEEIKDFPQQTTFNTDPMDTINEEVNDDGICTEIDPSDSGK